MEQVQKDLDAGKFNQICSNETTFKEYLQAFEKKTLEGTIRIGDVSEWINYGKARGYDKYLLESERQRIINELGEYYAEFDMPLKDKIVKIINASKEGIKLWN